MVCEDSNSKISVQIVPLMISTHNCDDEPSRTDINSIENLLVWDFDSTLLVQTQQQYKVIHLIFGSINCFDLLNIDRISFNCFLIDVKQGYDELIYSSHPRPYHNFVHGVDVTQTTFCFLKSMDGGVDLEEIEILALLFAALGHDIGHPGLTNQYIIASRHQLALEYENSSALEKMHAAKVQKLLKKHKIFAHQSKEKRAYVEKLIASAILSTDMAHHPQMLKDMGEIALSGPEIANNEYKLKFCSFLLHCADLSNPAKSWSIAEYWAGLIMKEFFTQGALEKAKDLPVSPNCDPFCTDVPLLQTQFIDFVIIPTFDVLQNVLPKSSIAIEYAKHNKVNWLEKKSKSLTIEQRSFFRELSLEKKYLMQHVWDPKLYDIEKNDFSSAHRITQNFFFTCFIGFLAFFSLFADDIRVGFFSIHEDIIFDRVATVLLFCFLSEIFLNFMSNENYWNSFYFWFDLIATISLLGDIYWLWKDLETTSTIGSAKSARVSRILRLIRLLRLVRIAKIYADSKKMNDFEDDTCNRFFDNSEVDKIFDRLADVATYEMTNSGMRALLEESFVNKKLVSDEMVDNLYFIMNLNVQTSISKSSFIRGIRILERKKHNNNCENVESSKENRRPESVLSKELGDLILRRVLVLVLLIILVTPHISDHGYDYDDARDYGLLQIHSYSKDFYAVKNDTNISKVRNNLFKNEALEYLKRTKPIYVSLHNVSKDYFKEPKFANVSKMLMSRYKIFQEYRLWEFNIVRVYGCSAPYKTVSIVKDEYFGQSVSKSCFSEAIFEKKSFTSKESRMNMLKTAVILICLVFGALILQRDTNKFLVTPFEHMLDVVQKIALNPLVKVDEISTDKENEIVLLETTLIKIASLVQIGFGEAGAEIISANMLNGGDFNPMLPGKKIYGIFGFCNIRGFVNYTEKLNEEIMIFTNTISEIVHSAVHEFGGNANKNIGESFLLVWKIPETSIDVSIVNVSQTPHHITTNQPISFFGEKSSKTNSTPNFQLNNGLTVADSALAAFLKVQLELKHAVKLDRYTDVNSDYSGNFSKKMPVDMGFGLHVGWAIEGAIGSKYKIDASYLSPDVNISSRLQGATKQFGTQLIMSHQFHSLLSNSIKKCCRELDCVVVKGSDKPLSLYTFDIVNYSKVNVQNIGDIEKLQCGLSEAFRASYDLAVQEYLAGRWENANSNFRKALEENDNDAPSKVLLQLIEVNQNKSPDNWPGYRMLINK